MFLFKHTIVNNIQMFTVVFQVVINFVVTTYKTTRYHKAEDHDWHLHSGENFRSQKNKRILINCKQPQNITGTVNTVY